MILCDADLDYLGRDDFEPIAATLYEELKVRDMVEDIPAWDGLEAESERARVERAGVLGASAAAREGIEVRA